MSQLDNLRLALSNVPTIADGPESPEPPLLLAADLLTMMAVRGWCDPRDLLPNAPDAALDAVLDGVAGDVETAPALHSGQWYLSASARQRVFATRSRETIGQELERVRVAADAADPVRLALRQEFGIEDRRPFADLSDETLVATGLVAGWLGQNRPDERAAIIAERAARARASDVVRLTRREMVGVSHNLAVSKLAALARAETPDLIAIGLNGVGGAGKSTLLANLERELAGDNTSAPLVLLDFDDRRLDPFDQLGLDLAFLSQISARFLDVAPAIAHLRSTIATQRLHLREARAAASTGPRHKGSRAEHFEQMESLGLESIRTFESSDRVSLLGDILPREAGRPEIHRLVLMLDTVEVVTARGMQAVIEMSDWIHSLHRLMGIERLLVIVSGRDRSAEGGMLSRLGAGEFALVPPLGLPDLEVEEAETLLRNAEVPAAAAESASRALPGNPLLLSIAAELMTSDANRALKMAEFHESGSIDPASATTYLSTRIVAHIADPVARPHVLGAIILPFLTRLFVQRLLIPFNEKRARMPDRKVSRAEADRVLAALRMTTWLAQPTIDSHLLRLRQDLREFALQLIRADPETRQMAEDLGRSAIAFHTDRSSAEDRASLLYHKTIVGQSSKPPRNLDALLQLLGPAARDLPAKDGAAFAKAAAHEDLPLSAPLSISLQREADALVRRNNAPEALALWRRHGAGGPPTFFIQALADSGQWDTAETDLESLLSGLAKLSLYHKEGISRVYWITRLALLRDGGRISGAHADFLEKVAASPLAQGSDFSALPALVAVAEAGLAVAGSFRPLAPETWLQAPRAGRQGRLLLVRFLAGQSPGGFSPLWDHIIVTDALWADRVADATGGAINLRDTQKRLNVLNDVRFSEVNRALRDLNRSPAPRIEPSQLSKSAMQLLLRGTDVEFLRPFGRVLANWWAEEPEMREPFVEIVAKHVLNEMTIRPSEFDPGVFRSHLLSEPLTWMSALVGYSDRCRLAPALCNAVRETPGWSDAATHARRVARSWRAWDMAILGESSFPAPQGADLMAGPEGEMAVGVDFRPLRELTNVNLGQTVLSPPEVPAEPELLMSVTGEEGPADPAFAAIPETDPGLEGAISAMPDHSDVGEHIAPLGGPDPGAPGQEEARSRLASTLRRFGPGTMEAVNQAVADGRLDLRDFDLSPEDLARLGRGGGAGLEDMGADLSGVRNPMGLEAIVERVGRPPMFIREDRVMFEPVALLPTLTIDVAQRIEKYIPSVGRIEFINHAMAWGGTGFVVAEAGNRRTVVTNRHVAAKVAQRLGDGRGVFMRSQSGVRYGARIDMREEIDSTLGDAFTMTVKDIAYLADDAAADVALFEIELRDGLAPVPIPLAERLPKDRELVCTIGYPAYDDRNDLAAMNAYFRDVYDVKRFAPGLITSVGEGILLSHDCTTLGGNSGSCLMSLDDEPAVLGLHFYGAANVRNQAVGAETLKALLSGTRSFVPGTALAAQDEGGSDGAHSAAELSDREGYHPGFLGEALQVPWPVPTPEIAADLAQPSDARDAADRELRYTHFGVLFSTLRRGPRVTAVNIDGSTTQRIKRTNDTWFYDLRIPRGIQLGNEAYADAEVDRGHMVRREDPNWGKAAQQANDDTFHYTNASLQHASLNQGRSLWLGLENYILDSARTEGFRACVFTGPIFRPDDPVIEVGAQVPLEFWKVVVMPAVGGGLHATGYVLSQGDLIRSLLEARNRSEAVEGFELGAYRTFQVAIAHIEEATGLSFPALQGADPMALPEGEEAAGVSFQPLMELTDVNLGETVPAPPEVPAALELRLAALQPAPFLARLVEAQAVADPSDTALARQLALLFQSYQVEVASPPDHEEAKAPDFATLKPAYEKLYASCLVTSAKKGEVAWYVGKLKSFRPHYEIVEAKLGTPWWFVGITHALEASFNFKGHLHNGDPLSRRTVQVPAGRPKIWNPPSDWESSAIDALTGEGYADQPDWSVAMSLRRFEGFNGWGYRSRGINTPYLWSFSNHYSKGKFVKDGKFDPTAVSKQCGAAVLMKALGIS